MPPSTRRSSARLAEQGSSPQASSTPTKSGGTKRKAAATTEGDSSPSATKSKRGRPSKEQKTLEETVSNAPAADAGNGQEAENDGKGGDEDVKMGDAAKDEGGAEGSSGDVNGKADGDKDDEAQKGGDAKESDEKADQEDVKDEAKKASTEQKGDAKTDDQNATANGDADGNALEHVKADVGDDGTTNKAKEESAKEDADLASASKEEAIEEDKSRAAAQPSNVLEKGIIYFFTRGRVGVDDPDSVQDLARSYFVMRPLPDGAKITDGAIQDLKNNRLVALPKKVWPKSGKDRFMCFVEKAGTSNATLKEEFYSGSEYSTQTVGTRQQPEVTPLGEGVYAITSTGGGQGTTHLVYMLTIPDSVGDVQKDVGLEAKGSFVVSLKNPEAPGPANAQLAQGPEYPKEFIEEFAGRGWMPAHPKHLDYANAQMLIIGEDFEASKNLEASAKDERDPKKETPGEELEKLEKEDEERVDHLKGDDSIFADLGISSKEYPKVKTTW